MEYTDILKNLPEWGFAVVAAIALFREMRREREAHAKQVSEIQTAHHAEVKELATVVQNNTIVLERLSEVIKNAESCD